MELLTESDIAVLGGNWDSGWTVTGQPWEEFYIYFSSGYAGGDGGTGGGGGGGSTGGPDTADPDCATTNPIVGVTPPDNARYLLPENITQEKLIGMLNHLSNFARANSAVSLLGEFKAMYDNPSHPFFMDFKDWGTAAGPSGSVSGGTTTYYSEAAGREVTGSAFEAFGNFWYGLAGTWAGISADVLYGAAALMQEGNTGLIPRDGPEDVPHVIAGITAAKNFKDTGQPAFTINLQSCAAATSVLVPLEGADILPFANMAAVFGEEAYHADLIGWIEMRFDEYSQHINSGLYP